jgi:hypothetical protein
LKIRNGSEFGQAYPQVVVFRPLQRRVERSRSHKCITANDDRRCHEGISDDEPFPRNPFQWGIARHRHGRGRPIENSRPDQETVRMLLEGLELVLQFPRMPDVIRVEERHELAVRLGNSTISCCGDPLVGLPEVSHTLTKRLKSCGRVVGRSVVYDDHLMG